MSRQMKIALEDAFPSKKAIEMHHREVRKIANRPSKRQRMLDSKKAEQISGRDELLYKGEDLKRRPR